MFQALHLTPWPKPAKVSLLEGLAERPD